MGTTETPIHSKGEPLKLTFNLCFPSGGLNSPYVVGNTFSSDDTFKRISNAPEERKALMM
jgi:hypothetical protein